MLVLNIKKELAAKNIDSALPWLVKIGIKRSSAVKLLSGKARRVSLSHIELLCEHLHCLPNDLFSWTPNGNAQRLANHPLQEIKAGSEAPNVQYYVERLPRKRLFKVEEYARQQMEEEIQNRNARIAERKKKNEEKK